LGSGVFAERTEAAPKIRAKIINLVFMVFCD
jgi:hypothetical protein